MSGVELSGVVLLDIMLSCVVLPDVILSCAEVPEHNSEQWLNLNILFVYNLQITEGIVVVPKVQNNV